MVVESILLYIMRTTEADGHQSRRLPRVTEATSVKRQLCSLASHVGDAVVPGEAARTPSPHVLMSFNPQLLLWGGEGWMQNREQSVHRAPGSSLN